MSVITVMGEVSCHTFVDCLLMSLILSKGHWTHDCLTQGGPEPDNLIIQAIADDPTSSQLARDLVGTSDGRIVQNGS
jgi:hypothetical protein